MTDPDYRQVDIPLVRARDHIPVGNLRLIRTRTWVLYDENGRRLAVPKHQDTLIVTLAGRSRTGTIRRIDATHRLDKLRQLSGLQFD